MANFDPPRPSCGPSAVARPRCGPPRCGPIRRPRIRKPVQRQCEFPQVFFFRHDDGPPSYLDDSAAPQTRQAFLNRLYGCISKVFHEERTIHCPPTSSCHLSRTTAGANTREKAVLVHFNGEAVAVRHFDWIASDRYHADNLRTIFPVTGSSKAAPADMKSITAHDTVLEVDITRPFTPRDYVFGRRRPARRGCRLSDRHSPRSRGCHGTRRWHRSEYATVRPQSRHRSPSNAAATVRRRAPSRGESPGAALRRLLLGRQLDVVFQLQPRLPARPYRPPSRRHLRAQPRRQSQALPASLFRQRHRLRCPEIEANREFDTNNDSIRTAVSSWRESLAARRQRDARQPPPPTRRRGHHHRRQPQPRSQRSVALLNAWSPRACNPTTTTPIAHHSVTPSGPSRLLAEIGRPPHFSYIVDKVSEHHLAPIPALQTCPRRRHRARRGHRHGGARDNM